MLKFKRLLSAIFIACLYGGGIMLYSCDFSDPNIPTEYTTYQPKALPACSIEIQEPLADRVKIKVILGSANREHLTEVKLCYSDQHEEPTLADRVEDLYPASGKKPDTLTTVLTELNPGVKYYCRLYIANADSSKYSRQASFYTKTDFVGARWEYVGALPQTYIVSWNAMKAGGRVFIITKRNVWTDLNGGQMWEFDSVQQTWIPKGDTPFKGRASLIYFSLGNNIYAGLGSNQWWDKGNYSIEPICYDWWCYDPEHDEWTALKDYPHNGGLSTFFSAKGKGYVLVRPDQLYEYDPATDKWMRKSTFPIKSHIGGASFVIEDCPYVFTGTSFDPDVANSNFFVKDLWEYDVDLDKWYQRADFPGMEREYMSSIACGNKGYAGFGYSVYSTASNGGYQLKGINDWWCYDPEIDEWSIRPIHSDWRDQIDPDFFFELNGDIYIGSVRSGLWRYGEK